MSHRLLTDASFFLFLEQIDGDSIATLTSKPCLHCGAPRDRADFWRKPRGDPRAEGGQVAIRRVSFCCRADGCRRRATPPQLRFLGRRSYLAVVVVLAACLLNGPNPARIATVARLVGAARTTVRRWVGWWRETFTKSPVWQERRARLRCPVDEEALPASLLGVFNESVREPPAALINLLRFITP